MPKKTVKHKTKVEMPYSKPAGSKKSGKKTKKY
jgi:hypothetical protein